MAIARLAPGVDALQLNRLIEGYKHAYADRRTRGEETAPLYPGARAVLAALAERDGVQLGIATGKSRRGLDHLLDAHGLRGLFGAAECADDHPSKPHPAMLEAALEALLVDAPDAVMLGDTTYDMEMARNAGVGAIGVAWGYHAPAMLTEAGAETVLAGYGDLLPYLQRTGRLA